MMEGNDYRIFFILNRENAQELFSTPTADSVALSARLLHISCNHFQHGIPCGMTILLIKLMKIINICEKDCKRLTKPVEF